MPCQHSEPEEVIGDRERLMKFAQEMLKNIILCLPANNHSPIENMLMWTECLSDNQKGGRKVSFHGDCIQMTLNIETFLHCGYGFSFQNEIY